MSLKGLLIHVVLDTYNRYVHVVLLRSFEVALSFAAMHSQIHVTSM